MNRVLFVLPVLLASFFAAGCTSPNRHLDVRIELLSDDPTLSIKEIEFVEVGISVGSPESDRNGKVISCTWSLQWHEENILILTLHQDGELFRSEVYELDASVLKSIGSETDWLNPDYASIDINLHWALLHSSGTSTNWMTKLFFLRE